MESKTKTALAAAAAISMVFGDHDLLCEILIRVAFPDSLVRAAAVCRRWLRAASDPAFLRRLRDLHPPPGLLGFYLTIHSSERRNFSVEFVPMLPHAPEIAALLRSARFSLNAYDSRSTRVLDCRAGRVVARLFRDGDFAHGVHTPLRPTRGLDVLPNLPTMGDTSNGSDWIFQDVLSKESSNGDGVSYIWFTLEYSAAEERATGCVYELQDGAWRMLLSASTQIPDLEDSKLKALSIFLADDKIYMGITTENILVLDLTSSIFFTIEFHDEMALDGDVRLAPGNGSEVYLVYTEDEKLCIWLHRGGNAGGEDWMLLHTIGLRHLCSIGNVFWINSHVYIHEVWQNAEFVLFEMCRCVFYLDVKSRALQKVYKVRGIDKNVCWIHPFMMTSTWLPIFPALKE